MIKQDWIEAAAEAEEIYGSDHLERWCAEWRAAKPNRFKIEIPSLKPSLKETEKSAKSLVGERGFEPPAPASRRPVPPSK